jgi:hypothetical protein
MKLLYVFNMPSVRPQDVGDRLAFLGTRCRNPRRRNAFEREPVGQALLKAAPDARRKRQSGVPQREGVLLNEGGLNVRITFSDRKYVLT